MKVRFSLSQSQENYICLVKKTATVAIWRNLIRICGIKDNRLLFFFEKEEKKAVFQKLGFFCPKPLRKLACCSTVVKKKKHFRSLQYAVLLTVQSAAAKRFFKPPHCCTACCSSRTMFPPDTNPSSRETLLRCVLAPAPFPLQSGRSCWRVQLDPPSASLPPSGGLIFHRAASSHGIALQEGPHTADWQHRSRGDKRRHPRRPDDSVHTSLSKHLGALLSLAVAFQGHPPLDPPPSPPVIDPNRVHTRSLH